MPSANLAKLQATINRFAETRFAENAGFAPIAADGGMGEQTVVALASVMRWLSADGCVGLIPFVTKECISTATKAEASRWLLSSVTQGNQTEIMLQNVALNTFLGQAAKELDLGEAKAVPSVLPAPGFQPPFVAPDLTIPGASKGFTADLQIWFKKLPTWQKIGLGVLGGLSFLFAAGKIRKMSKMRPPAKAAGTAGYRRGR